MKYDKHSKVKEASEKYEADKKNPEGHKYEYKNEDEFEYTFIQYLTKIGGVKQWRYEENINTTEDLWDNLKKIIEDRNENKIREGNIGFSDKKTLTDTEFTQIKRVISNLKTPYEAGQFLFGTNGVAQVEIDLESGKHIVLSIFDQSKVGGGDNVYQIVNQIEREKIVTGKPNRRFDVTLLINGLPIIQIELKNKMHRANEALNQMEQYIEERQYSDIFSTVQILIAMTPYEIKYMANTERGRFNKAFAFDWQDEKTAKKIVDWRIFSDKVLSIPMAHDMSTRYMILDGTKNKESIKVMRPYQVYATKRVIEKVRTHQFDYDDTKLGYIWHTTGSGKTITSFKTAWLASREPNVNKVVFLVDRIALTNQTTESYKAYDPSSGEDGKYGVIMDTANVDDLVRKMTIKSDKNIIVTSIQKMSRYVSGKKFKKIDDNILFIVDEAHRSTGDGREDNNSMMDRIRKAMPNAAWVGYTGTPNFDDSGRGKSVTEEVFGQCLHSYTIKEAISDRNVLGFNVEFKETIAPPENPTKEDIDDMVKSSVYDNSKDHVKLVVEDIFKNWKKRSNDRKYNAILTVHVGGNRASTPRVMEYFDEFERVNSILDEKDRLKVAVSFSEDTSNGDNMLDTNENLGRAIQKYNQMFGTAFDMSMPRFYREDVARRLNKSADDKNYLDLVIVIDQLLTGFDAPELNTLYVDRTLKGANLIQAYSRTNRIHNRIDKPWGNIINYRWPKENEEEMNKALSMYANRDNALKQESMEEIKEGNTKDGIISKGYEKTAEEINILSSEIRDLTEGFTETPKSERDCEILVDKLHTYNKLVGEIKQYSEDGDGNPVSIEENPEKFYLDIGITQEEEIRLTTVIANDAKERVAKNKNIDISEIDLSMVHIHDIRINYDYLVELIAELSDVLNGLNDENLDDKEKSKKTEDIKEEIKLEASKLENEKERWRIFKFIKRLITGEHKINGKAPRNVELMNAEIDKAQRESNARLIASFISTWGIGYNTTAKDLEEVISKHRAGNSEDMDKQNELNNIMNNAHDHYKELADEKVAKMSWVRYRKNFREAIYKMADEIVEG